MKALLFVLVFIPSIALAETPLTFELVDGLSLETNSLIATSVAAVSFFLGWVAGASQ